MSKRIIEFVVVLVFLLSGIAHGEELAPAGASHAPATQPQLNLLAMGDWGSNNDTQRQVAATMGGYLKSSGRTFSGMLLCGDNFYVPLENGIRDSKWKTMFEDRYDPSIFNFPFYVSLGNHDYQMDRFLIEYAYAQANPESRWKMPSRWYRVEIPKENPLLTVLMLDSNKPLLGDKQWADELKWIAAEMKKPRTSPWLICAAHHPFFSDGDHGDIGPLQSEWGPLFAKGGVDFYICGHDHDLQHLEVKGFPETFLLVGGGGAHTRPIRTDATRRGPFAKATHGFADLSFTPTSATVRLISGKDASVLHEFTRSKDGRVVVTQSVPSDHATPRTIRSITRGQSEVEPAKARTPTTAPSSFNKAPSYAP
jgi:hypothetical protein